MISQVQYPLLVPKKTMRNMMLRCQNSYSAYIPSRKRRHMANRRSGVMMTARSVVNLYVYEDNDASRFLISVSSFGLVWSSSSTIRR